MRSAGQRVVSDRRAAMDEFELTAQYFNYVKNIGRIFGMWPFDRDRKKFIIQYILYFLYFFGLFVQIARLSREFSFMALAEQCPYIGVTFASFTKYINSNVYTRRFVRLLNSVQADLLEKRTDLERSIFFNRVKQVTFYATLYKGIIYMGIAGFTLLPFMPSILDVINPLNESRPHLFVFPAYYFVDEDRFFYIIEFYTVFCVYHVAFVFLTADMTLMYLAQHSCALLDLAGYRFMHATDDIVTPLKDPSLEIAEKYKKVVLSIKSHNRAIEILAEIESLYAINLFLQISNATFLMTVTLLVVTLRGFCVETYALYAFIPVQVVHLLIPMFQGQSVNNANDIIYNNMYESLWHEQPAKIQSLYVLALRRGLTPPLLTAGGLIELNLDNFANIMKAAVSYCTFLRSTG